MLNIILRKKKSIKKYLLLQDDFIEKNIVILGGSTTSEIKNILEEERHFTKSQMGLNYGEMKDITERL